jgi:Na+-driven multidrug efflux pump
MQTSLNQNFTPWTLLKFAAPSIAMMLLMSLYTIVDGIFVSRFVGSNALSALNIVYPIVNIAIAITMMFASGGNAIISKYLGEGRNKEAREALSQFIVIGLGVGIFMLVLTLLFLTPISRFLGATDLILADCRTYLGTIILFLPACILQTLFQSYLVTAGHPTLGLVLMTGAGILNMIFDYILIVPLQMG